MCLSWWILFLTWNIWVESLNCIKSFSGFLKHVLWTTYLSLHPGVKYVYNIQASEERKTIDSCVTTQYVGFMWVSSCHFIHWKDMTLCIIDFNTMKTKICVAYKPYWFIARVIKNTYKHALIEPGVCSINISSYNWIFVTDSVPWEASLQTELNVQQVFTTNVPLRSTPVEEQRKKSSYNSVPTSALAGALELEWPFRVGPGGPGWPGSFPRDQLLGVTLVRHSFTTEAISKGSEC